MTSISIKFDRFFFGLAGIAAATVVAGITPACATTYFVSPSGSDANAGTSKNHPLQSFWAVGQHLQSGDTLEIMPGTYQSFGIGVSGTVNNPTRYVAQDPTNKPQIVGSTYPAVWVQANYVVIDGLDVTTGQQSSAAGLQIFQSNHVTVQNTVAHDSGGGGLMSMYSDYINFNHNVAYNNSAAASDQTSGISLGFGVNSDTVPHTHNVIASNISYNNMDVVPFPGTNYTTDGSGIIVDSMDAAGPYVGGTVIYNNIVYNNGGSGIRMFRSSNVYVTNNTSVGNLQGTTLNGLKGEISNFQGSKNVIRNNVVNATISDAYAIIDAGTTGSSYDYNLTNGGMPAQRFIYASNALWGQHNMFGQDPQFVSSTNFMVQPTSMVLGNANGQVSPLRDIRGMLRPANRVSIDLGAFQQSQ